MEEGQIQYIEPKDVCTLLSDHRYPSNDEIERLPLGKSVIENINNVDARYCGDGTNGHIHRVMDGINILLGEEPYNIVKQWSGPKGIASDECRSFLNTLKNFVKNQDLTDTIISGNNYEYFLRICAFYHDVGKSIITERHPSVGWHLVRDVHAEEVKDFLYPLVVRRSYSDWKSNPRLTTKEKRLLNIFVSVIKYHDLFGVLSTGEASYPVMMDLIPLIGANVDEAIELFYILFIVNLADTYGSVPELYPYKVMHFCNDLDLLCRTIREAQGDRNLFFEKLINISQSTTHTIGRIKRFLVEGTPLDWQILLNNEQDIIDDAFKNATIAGQYKFCKNFALFCKLDYGLSFKLMMMKKAKGSSKDIRNPVSKIVEYLVQLERQYGDLCQRNDNTWRRLGLQLSGLTRKPPNSRQEDESKIGNAICDLLLNSDTGKEWASSECTVWFMEE